MAIYHLTTKPISRSSGRSATASAAYRAACKITDERTGEIHDYTRKSGVLYSEIITPDNVPIDRSELWNKAEAAERRKDARIAREIIIALPAELDALEREELAVTFARELVNDYGVAVDVCIHQPDKGGDNRNHHAHLLMTTRKADFFPENNEIKLGEKSDLELSDKKLRELGKATGKQQIEAIRERWADMANRCLAHYGIDERIDHRSFEAQGVDRLPTIHVGPKATQMERRGERTDKGDKNRAVLHFNREKAEFEQAPKVCRFDEIRQIGNAEFELEQLKAQRENERAEAAAVAAQLKAFERAQAAKAAAEQAAKDKVEAAKKLLADVAEAKEISEKVKYVENLTFDDYLRGDTEYNRVVDRLETYENKHRETQNDLNRLQKEYTEAQPKFLGFGGDKRRAERIKVEYNSTHKLAVIYKNDIETAQQDKQKIVEKLKQAFKTMKDLAKEVAETRLKPLLERLKDVSKGDVAEAKKIVFKDTLGASKGLLHEQEAARSVKPRQTIERDDDSRGMSR